MQHELIFDYKVVFFAFQSICNTFFQPLCLEMILELNSSFDFKKIDYIFEYFEKPQLTHLTTVLRNAT